ncbi:hypothetical protein RRG08_055683 [Elysia crispata]|uniref:Uncharacterized protein n=1 Tax=Elysia crispata TaxID=231223 RepID=A0AAE0ZZI6_9GAST|nr:hypothetical protein RRG08_055683 [Elysia crispata]
MEMDTLEFSGAGATTFTFITGAVTTTIIIFISDAGANIFISRASTFISGAVTTTIIIFISDAGANIFISRAGATTSTFISGARTITIINTATSEEQLGLEVFF